MEFFIIDNNGQQAGPFSLDQLAQKAITPETLVWKQGMKDWTPAWKVAELKNVLEAAEAIRANAAENNAAQGYTQGTVPPGYQGQGGANQQQNFQQAQQAAYQQGFQHGAAMNQGAGYGNNGAGYNGAGYNGAGYANDPNHPKKKSSKTLRKIILCLIVFIFLVFALTNPGEEAHKEKVRTEVGKAIEKATATTDNNFFTQAMRSVAKMMADNVMGEAMDQLFEYHNYIICSKGSVTFDGKEHSISFGILGKVYTMNADDMVKALEDGDNLRIEESEESSDGSNAVGNDSSDGSDDSDNASASDNSSDDEGGIGANVQKKLEEKANQAFDKAADKVSKKVEEKINQKLNEAADSSKIEKIIDKILELI